MRHSTSMHTTATEDHILAEVCRTIGRASDPGAAIQAASDTLQDFFQTTAFGIWLLEDEGRLELTVSIFNAGVSEEVRETIRRRFDKVSIEDDLPGRVALRTRKCVRHSRGDPTFGATMEAAVAALGVDWICSIPLETEMGPVGVAVLMGPEGTLPDTEDENVLKFALGQLALLARAIRMSHQETAYVEEFRVLNAAVDRLPALLTVIQPDLTIRRMNPAVEEILGYSPGEVVGQTVFVLSDEPAELERAIEEAVRQGSWAGELRHRHKDGRSVHMDTVLASAFDSEGNLQGVLDISRDLTEEKLRNERSVQSNRLAVLGRLAAGVAHEVNNPLTSIHFLAALLAQEEFPEDTLIDLHSIMAEAQRAGAIVRNLLAFAHHEKPRRQPVALRQIVDAVVQLQDASLPGESVRVDVMEEQVPAVMADPDQIKQVIHNLLSNARHEVRDAGAEGRVRIRIRNAEEGWVALDVEDTGRGIPTEVQSRLFTPFFTTKAVGEGTGLGLSISYSIMNEHAGKLTAENWGRPPVDGGTPGQGGARFTMLLPALENLAEEAGVAGSPTSSGERVRVLVVDDEPALSTVLRRILERAGHHAEAVNSGDEALKRLETERYDAIISDVRMPGMSGTELFRRAIYRKPELESLFIFTSGDVTSSEIQAFLNRTGRPYLAKPFELDDLWRVLNVVVERRTR